MAFLDLRDTKELVSRGGGIPMATLVSLLVQWQERAGQGVNEAGWAICLPLQHRGKEERSGSCSECQLSSMKRGRC